jgi:hypothetical protein
MLGHLCLSRWLDNSWEYRAAPGNLCTLGFVNQSDTACALQCLISANFSAKSIAAGSPMRVQLVTRGSWFMQESLMPKRRAPRIHMLFPLSGPVQSGVVSLQVRGCFIVLEQQQQQQQQQHG